MDFLLSVGSSNRTKRLTSPPPPSSKKELFLPNCLVLGHGSFPAFRLRHQRFLGLKAACQFSDWNLYCWLSRSSDLCSWTWTMSSILLGLQLANCRSLVYSHIINLSFSLSHICILGWPRCSFRFLIWTFWAIQYIHVYIFFYWFCFSGKPCLSNIFYEPLNLFFRIFLTMNMCRCEVIFFRDLLKRSYTVDLSTGNRWVSKMMAE